MYILKKSTVYDSTYSYYLHPNEYGQGYIAINLHLIVTSVGSCVANLWQSRRFKLEYFSYDYRNK